MHNKNPEDEDSNPFPANEGYQDGDNNKHLSGGKIPIQIYGRSIFYLLAEAGQSLAAGVPCNESLEEGLGRVMRACRQNARVHLNLIIEGLVKPTGEDELAKKIVNYKGYLDDLFMLVYPKSCRKSIEKQLGRYGNLEKKVIDKHK